jgi:hypothetical protein
MIHHSLLYCYWVMVVHYKIEKFYVAKSTFFFVKTKSTFYSSQENKKNISQSSFFLLKFLYVFCLKILVFLLDDISINKSKSKIFYE